MQLCTSGLHRVPFFTIRNEGAPFMLELNNIDIKELEVPLSSLWTLGIYGDRGFASAGSTSGARRIAKVVVMGPNGPRN